MQLVFSGCLFTLDVGSGISCKNVRRKILSNGGKASLTVSKKTNFVITNPDSNVTSHVRSTAQKFSIPQVSEGFVDACLEKSCVLDPADFVISSSGKEAKHDEDVKVDEPQRRGKDVGASVCKKFVLSSKDMEGYELLKSIVLKGMCKANELDSQQAENMQCYCVLELHANEALFSQEGAFSVLQHMCSLEELKNLGGASPSTPRACYYDTLPDALAFYESLYSKLTGPPNCLTETDDVPQGMGSAVFQMMQSELLMSTRSLDANVASLVDTVWDEALGKLDSILKVAPLSLPLWRVEQAEAILCQINAVLSKPNSSGVVSKLTKEFYSILPHHPEHITDIDTVKHLVEKRELCQLLHDIVSVNENVSSEKESELLSKYRSLRCQIDHLPPDNKDRQEVCELIFESEKRPVPIEIRNVYSVRRYVEHVDFTHSMSNRKKLFHSSAPSNFLGILSRGLLLPHKVVEERGTQRRDRGMLGAGIYFADSVNTSIKYSSPCKSRQTRFLVVCEVALGKVYQVHHFVPELVSPPDGYNSVHGTAASEAASSDFVDDEFAIYDVRQQHLSYLVEFSLPSLDKAVPDLSESKAASTAQSALPYPLASLLSNDQQNTPECLQKSPSWPQPNKTSVPQVAYNYDCEDISNQVDPASKIEVGLIGGDKDGSPFSLTEIHVRAKLVDLVGQVVLFQVYKNSSFKHITEAKYVFPLEYSSTVCGFEAYVDGRHIVGKVKEKTQAHREYKEAVTKGKKALLMDEETPDIFSVSIGNVPTQATVIIKITYVMELAVDGDVVRFSLPSCVAQSSKKQTTGAFGTKVLKLDRAAATFSFAVSLEMPFEIKALWSSTHKISSKKTDTKAVICQAGDPKDNHLDDDGLVLFFKIDNPHTSRMWVENHPSRESQACMISFYPEFEIQKISDPEIIIAIDCSNSMLGNPFQDALKVALCILNFLPQDCFFNMLAFGTVFKEAFPASRPFSQSTKKAAAEFIRKIDPSMGNTEFFRPLRAYCLMKNSRAANMVLISDGHVNNDGPIIRIAKSAGLHVRLFPLGITNSANKHFLQRLALAGGGIFEYLDPARKSTWGRKIREQIERCCQQALRDVSIEWQQFDEPMDSIRQAPCRLPSLFSGSHLVIYAFIPHCYLATVKAVIEDKEFTSVVSSAAILATEGQTVHRLAARAVIRDWEEGLLAEDWGTDVEKRKRLEDTVVNLSLKYDIVTTLTSFVAIEDEKDDTLPQGSSLMAHLLEKDNVDTLPYLAFQTSEDAVDEGFLEEKVTCRMSKKKKKKMVTYDVFEFRDHSEEEDERMEVSEIPESLVEAPKVLKLAAPPSRVSLAEHKASKVRYTGGGYGDPQPQVSPVQISHLSARPKSPPSGFAESSSFMVPVFPPTLDYPSKSSQPSRFQLASSRLDPRSLAAPCSLRSSFLKSKPESTFQQLQSASSLHFDAMPPGASAAPTSAASSLFSGIAASSFFGVPAAVPSSGFPPSFPQTSSYAFGSPSPVQPSVMHQQAQFAGLSPLGAMPPVAATARHRRAQVLGPAPSEAISRPLDAASASPDGSVSSPFAISTSSYELFVSTSKGDQSAEPNASGSPRSSIDSADDSEYYRKRKEARDRGEKLEREDRTWISRTGKRESPLRSRRGPGISDENDVFYWKEESDFMYSDVDDAPADNISADLESPKADRLKRPAKMHRRVANEHDQQSGDDDTEKRLSEARQIFGSSSSSSRSQSGAERSASESSLLDRDCYFEQSCIIPQKRHYSLDSATVQHLSTDDLTKDDAAGDFVSKVKSRKVYTRKQLIKEIDTYIEAKREADKDKQQSTDDLEVESETEKSTSESSSSTTPSLAEEIAKVENAYEEYFADQIGDPGLPSAGLPNPSRIVKRLARNKVPATELIQECSRRFGGGFPFLVMTLFKFFNMSQSEVEKLESDIQKEFGDELQRLARYKAFDEEIVECLAETVEKNIYKLEEKKVFSAVFNSQDEAGFFNVPVGVPKIDRLCEALKEMLVASGLSSLGSAAATKIEQAVLVAGIFLWLLSKSFEGAFFAYLEKIMKTRFSDLQVLAMFGLMTLGIMQHQTNISKDRWELALQYLKEVDEKYPLAYSTLDLGNNWECAIWKHINKDIQ